jgi:hypothetical protein
MELGRWSILVTLTLSNKFTIYTYLHSIWTYEIIFLVNSSNSGEIFTLQIKIVGIMAGAQPRAGSSGRAV